MPEPPKIRMRMDFLVSFPASNLPADPATSRAQSSPRNTLYPSAPLPPAPVGSCETTAARTRPALSHLLLDTQSLPRIRPQRAPLRHPALQESALRMQGKTVLCLVWSGQRWDRTSTSPRGRRQAQNSEASPQQDEDLADGRSP